MNVVLQSVRPSHGIMSWTMEKGMRKPRTGTTREQVMQDFAQPRVSPIWKALSLGSDLRRLDSMWPAFRAFHRGNRGDGILRNDMGGNASECRHYLLEDARAAWWSLGP